MTHISVTCTIPHTTNILTSRTTQRLTRDRSDRKTQTAAKENSKKEEIEERGLHLLVFPYLHKVKYNKKTEGEEVEGDTSELLSINDTLVKKRRE